MKKVLSLSKELVSRFGPVMSAGPDDSANTGVIPPIKKPAPPVKAPPPDDAPADGQG